MCAKVYEVLIGMKQRLEKSEEKHLRDLHDVRDECFWSVVINLLQLVDNVELETIHFCFMLAMLAWMQTCHQICLG